MPNSRSNSLVDDATFERMALIWAGVMAPPASKHNNQHNDEQDAYRNRQNLEEIVVGSLTLRSLYYLGGHTQSLKFMP
jgi:hypothetical protein